jgi:tetratricopeptide (TPR) repeat protein
MGGFFRRPKTWQDYFEKGMGRGEAADFSAAEVSFREAARLAPEEPYPHYELGYTLALVGRHEEALDELRRTEQLRRGFFIVETEIWMCEQVLSGSIDASLVEMLRGLQWIVDDGGSQSEEAAGLSAKAIESAPNCALGHFHFGKALIERDPAAAEEALRRCIELHPDDTTAINAKAHVAILCEQAGRKDEARTIRQGILADYPGHPHTVLVNGPTLHAAP